MIVLDIPPKQAHVVSTPMWSVVDHRVIVEASIVLGFSDIDDAGNVTDSETNNDIEFLIN